MDVSDLSKNAESREDVVSLMKKEFPSGATASQPRPFEEEFAALLSDNDPAHILFACESKENTKPLAALAWKSFTLKQGLKIAALGLVVTDASERKRGLSRRLILEAETRAHAEGCAVMCLWSDLLEFYTKLGYVLAGSEISWDLSEVPDIEELAVSENFPETAFREATLEDLPALAQLYARETTGPQRDARVYTRQLEQSDSLSLVACLDGAPQAYALAGKGRDLRNVVHELIGDSKFFPALLERMRKTLSAQDPSTPVRLQFPASHPLRGDLEALFAAGEQGAVCFAKILRIDDVIAAFNTELDTQGFDTLRIRHLTDINAWTLEDGKQDIFMSPDPAHLLQVFCQPWELEELEGLPGRTLKRLAGWRPYPLYFWGPDGV